MQFFKVTCHLGTQQLIIFWFSETEVTIFEGSHFQKNLKQW